MGFGNPTTGLMQTNPWNELSQAIAQMPEFKIQQLQAEQLQEQVAQTGYQNLIGAALTKPEIATNPNVVKQMTQYATQMKIPPPVTTNEAGIPSLDMKAIGSYAATQFVQANPQVWFNFSADQRLALSNAHNWGLATDDPLIQAPQSISIYQQDEVSRNMQAAIDKASQMAGQSGSETSFGAIFAMKKPYNEAMNSPTAFDDLIQQIQPMILQDMDRGTQRLNITNEKDKATIARLRDQVKNADSLTGAQLAYDQYRTIIEKYQAQFAPQMEAAKLQHLQQTTQTSAAQASRYRTLASTAGLNPIQRANYLKGAWTASGGQLKDLVHQAQAIQANIANAPADSDTTQWQGMLTNTLDQIRAAEPQYYSDAVAQAISAAQINGDKGRMAVAQMAEAALESAQGNTDATSLDVMEQQDPKTFALLQAQFPDLVKFVKGEATSYEQDAQTIAPSQ